MVGFLSKLVKRSGEDQSEPEIDVPKVDKGDAIYAIGDIHGRDDLLIKIFDQISEDIEKRETTRVPLIVFLGDYIDRGDHSREVVDLLMAIENEVAEGAVFLRGNHEAALLDFIEDPVQKSAWLRFGGLQTLGSYRIKPPNAPLNAKDLETVADELADALGPQLSFFRKTELMLRSGDVIFTHAGIDPNSPLEKQTEDALLWGRSAFIETGGVSNLRVVHGHYDSQEVISTPYRVCVDTGAYYTGRLSAVRLDDGEEIITANAIGGT